MQSYTRQGILFNGFPYILVLMQEVGYIQFSVAMRFDPYTVIVEQDEEGYFVANVPELRGCHAQADSLDVLMQRVADAITLCLPDGPRMQWRA